MLKARTVHVMQALIQIVDAADNGRKDETNNEEHTNDLPAKVCAVIVVMSSVSIWLYHTTIIILVTTALAAATLRVQHKYTTDGRNKSI